MFGWLQGEREGVGERSKSEREMAGEIAVPTCRLWRSQLQMHIWVECAVKESVCERDIGAFPFFFPVSVFNHSKNKVVYKRKELKGNLMLKVENYSKKKKERNE